MPTHMGSTASPPESFRITMGILVTGSIIKPRIFISTSILGPCFGSDYHFSDQTVREACGDADIGVTPDRKLGLWRNSEIQGLVLRGATNPLSASFVSGFNHYFSYFADMPHIAGFLDLPLPLHKDGQAARLLVLGDAVDHSECRGVRARRILEGENAVELHFVQQAHRLFKVFYCFPGEANDHVSSD